MAALEWGVSPEEYFSWSKTGRVFAMAALRVKAALVDVLSEVARKRSERESKLRRG